MDTKNQSSDNLGLVLISLLLIALTYAGIITYKNIQFDVLEKLEAAPLNLPTPQTPQPH